MTDKKGRFYSFIAIYVEFSERENNRTILKPSWYKCMPWWWWWKGTQTVEMYTLFRDYEATEYIKEDMYTIHGDNFWNSFYPKEIQSIPRMNQSVNTKKESLQHSQKWRFHTSEGMSEQRSRCYCVCLIASISAHCLQEARNGHKRTLILKPAWKKKYELIRECICVIM